MNADLSSHRTRANRRPSGPVEDRTPLPEPVTLADALDAYAMAVAYRVDSITQASRFADLTAAHQAHVTDLYRKEQA